MADKVKLPRYVVNALKEVEEDWKNDPELIAWLIPKRSRAEVERHGHSEAWVVLHDYANTTNGGFFRLVDAIRYGYEPEPEPITVTITPEQQEQIKRLYDSWDGPDEWSGGKQSGIRETLHLLGIKIPGIPPED